MKIDDTFSIKKSGGNYTLVKRVLKHRTTDKEHRWKRGDAYESTEEFYYGSVKQALMGYMKHSPNDAASVSDILVRMNDAEERVRDFLKYNGC